MSVSSCYSFFFLCILIPITDGTELVILNNCKESIWPGLLGTEGHLTPEEGGFHLPSGKETILQVPENWSGRIWARQGCFQTGDCAGLLQCKGIGGLPPATLVEITLGTPKSSLHYYDVSLVDGFNVPVSMTPVGFGRGGDGGGGGAECGVAACEADLNSCCPCRLVVKRQGKVVGCKSACLAARTDRYCCTGDFANPKNCKAYCVWSYVQRPYVLELIAFLMMMLQASRLV